MASADHQGQWATLDAEIIGCRRCPRLVAYREEIARVKRPAYHDWDYWGRPVPGLGDPNARLLIIGLAPGAHGANRTGRMFTGNSSGLTLMAALHRAGFSNQPISRHRDDGLALKDVFITAIARCVPPKNRPTRAELANCRPFLAREWALLSSVRVVVALGRMAFDGYLRLLQERGVHVARLAFRHGAHCSFDPPLPSLIASYHPSRQNTQTGRLTEAMLDAVFSLARRLCDSSA